MDRIRETFNDGVLIVKEQITLRNELKRKIGSEYKEFCKLHYRNTMIRDSDLNAMQGIGSRVSKKVKTPFHPFVKKKNKDEYFIEIEGDMFNVIYVD